MSRQKIGIQHNLEYISYLILWKCQNAQSSTVQRAKWVFANSAEKVDWEFCTRNPLDGAEHSSSGLNGTSVKATMLQAHSLYLDRLGLLPAQPRNIARFFCHQTSLIFRILFLVLAFIIWDTWQDQKRLISAAGILAIVGFGAGNSPTFIVGPGLLIARFFGWQSWHYLVISQS